MWDLVALLPIDYIILESMGDDGHDTAKKRYLNLFRLFRMVRGALTCLCCRRPIIVSCRVG